MDATLIVRRTDNGRSHPAHMVISWIEGENETIGRQPSRKADAEADWDNINHRWPKFGPDHPAYDQFYIVTLSDFDMAAALKEVGGDIMQFKLETPLLERRIGDRATLNTAHRIVRAGADIIAENRLEKW